ncbi:MAG: hypothetical protein FWH36_06015, partial [Lentimicrobiaceae bacterium]|nr:hypothetical protein [Lentimicrobiaceae bacterium]
VGFQQVTRNDSLYGTACYEIALGYYVQKAYDSALVYVRKSVDSKQAGIVEQSRTLMGTIFDDAGMPDSAVACYRTSLKLRPYAAGLWYDLGTTYYRMDSLDLAEQCLMQAIKINPSYYKANLGLAFLNEKKNRRIEAMLCYYMANLVTPSAELTRTIELYLGGESEIKPLLSEYVPTCPSFEQLEDYINSKIAMTPKYKPVFKSQAAVVRQGDLLFKYLEYDPQIDNFYMNYYVRIFTFLRDKKQVETCMYIYFSGFDNEKVQKWIKSNMPKIKKFYGMLNDETYKYATKGFVNDANYKGMNYVYSDYVFSEFGKYSDEKNKVYDGLWTVVERDGSISAEVNYKNGKLEGEIKTFNSNGQLTSILPYVNGETAGKATFYHDNGQLFAEAEFENDKLNGKVVRYFYTGQKRTDENYKNGVEHGLMINYFKNGTIDDSLSWANGKRNGEIRSMYADNQLHSKWQFVNDAIEGERVHYYSDGQIYSQGNYVKDNYVGKWTYYHPNGAVKSVDFYNDKGNLSDTTKNFDACGVLTTTAVYSNNGKNVQKTFYRQDGSIYRKEEWKNDNPVKMESFDKDGKSLEVTNISSSGTYMKYYNLFGNISAEGMLKNGKEDGRWILYGLVGNIERISYYKNGERNGTDTAFFSNGKIKSIENFKEDKYDGYVAIYNLAGIIAAEGYYINNVKEGYWLYYDNAGNLTQKNYFSNDEIDQWQEYYYPNGNLRQEVYYDNYLIREIINYDSTGKEYERLNVPDSACKITEHYPNGKIKSEIHYLGGIPNGLQTYFHANGQKNMSYNQILDKIYDTISIYDENGICESKAEYINDKLYGNGVRIIENERIETKYFNGQRYDTSKYYSEENKLVSAIAYMEDQRHGWASYYGENGELAFQLLYYKGVAIEYISPKDNQRIKIENDQKITTYYANGKISAEISFLNGLYHGEFARYYANGKLYRKCYYEAGTYNGVFSEYYPNGNLKKEINYRHDDYDGTTKKYYSNGKLKEELFYIADKKHGGQKSYNQQGELIKTTTYYYGDIEE